MGWKEQAKRAVVDSPVKAENPDLLRAAKLDGMLVDGLIPTGQKDFASSLLRGFTKYGSFTEKQRPYVDKLIDPVKPVVSDVNDGFVHSLDLSMLKSGLYAVEQRRYQIDNVASGKWAGWVFVKDGSAYGAGERYGAQRPGERFVARGRSDRMADLKQIAADPFEASKQYGRITGRCGVCGAVLENEESKARGIGPICAGRFA